MGDAPYTESDGRGRLVSIIHEALKKIEGGRSGYISAQAGRPVALKRPARSMTVILAVLTLFAAVSATIYTVWREKAPSVQATAQNPVLVQAVEPGLSPDDVASEPVASAVQAGAQNQAWTDTKAVELFKLGRYHEAVAEFAEGVRRAPENIVYLNNLALAFFKADKIAEAEEAYKKALAINPDYAEALNNYGGLLAARGDLSGAIKKYRAAYALKPDYRDAYLNSAIAHELSGDLKTAVQDYERFLGLSDGAKDAETIAAVGKKLLSLRSALIIEDVQGRRN